MEAWQKNKRWSDRFLPEMKEILGRHFIGEPHRREDMEHNTDLVVLEMYPLRFACRVRRHKYIADYGNQFTVRWRAKNGGKTEMSKIIEGWGDYMLYAFANKEETKLCQWEIIDLKRFRLWFFKETKNNQGRTPGVRFNNPDKTMGVAFELPDMPQGVVFDRNPPP